jgi:hypothetical protein
MGLAGTYRKVVAKHKLGDPRSRRGRKRFTGGQVAILECGHARTGIHSYRNARAWCGVCTRQDQAKRKRKVLLTEHELEQLIEREVLRRMKAESG